MLADVEPVVCKEVRRDYVEVRSRGNSSWNGMNGSYEYHECGEIVYGVATFPSVAATRLPHGRLNGRSTDG